MKEKKLSIAFVNPLFMPEYYEGSGKQTIRLISNLKIKNINAFILTPKLKKNTPTKNFENNILIRRFKVNHLPNLGGRYFFSFITWSIKLIYWLLKNSNKFDLIHVIHGRLHAIPAIFAAKILKKPVIVKLGRGGEKYFDIDAVDNKKIIGPFFSKYLVKNVTGWIANSELITKNLKNYKIKDKLIHKIFNGIDIKEIRINKFRKNKTFIVVGRLSEEKLCNQIISVFSKIPENLNVKLVFLGKDYGDGSQRNYLEKITNDLNQTHRITFRGEVEDVNDQLNNADFYLSASKSEGMSNALLESMALGVPAIVSNVSGVEEIIINNKNGFIFEQGNEKLFYDKIIKAINFSEEDYNKMSLSASEHIYKNFSIERVSNEHIKLYKNLINN
mgnify:FL=1|tara:strand:- start:4940 stop:6103 length:1164 start_codon:yes stop_codon:yes gene_type:complete